MLLVRRAICRFECLNRFVMYLVSLPAYVKVIHLRSFSGMWSGGVSFGDVVCVSRDPEGVVEEDIVDYVFFSLVFFFVELEGV